MNVVVFKPFEVFDMSIIYTLWYFYCGYCVGVIIELHYYVITLIITSCRPNGT